MAENLGSKNRVHAAALRERKARESLTGLEAKTPHGAGKTDGIGAQEHAPNAPCTNESQ
jgi:hypothetical protein